MNILYVLNTTIETDGANKSFFQLAKSLKNQGHNLWVAVPSRTGISNTLEDFGVHILQAPIRPAIYPDCRNAFYTIFFLARLLYWQILNHYAHKKLMGLLKNIKIDIVHSNVSIIDTGYKIAKKLKCPHIYHIREYGEKDFNMHYFPTRDIYWEKMHKKDSYCICITKDIMKYDNLSYANSRVIYNGIYPSSCIIKKSSKKKYFLYAGRIQQAKGVFELVEAYCAYASKRESPMKLIIIGRVVDNNYYKKILKYIKQRNMNRHIIVKKPINDIAILMREATAIIIPSIQEGFGRCMAEAMFNDCLVIGKNTAGTKEQFDNGYEYTGEEIGLRYTQNKDLTKILEFVSSHDPNYFIEYKERARKTILHYYTTEKYIESVENFYKYIIKNK